MKRLRSARFSLMELLIATVLFAAAVAPLITMIVDCQLRVAESLRRREAITLADSLLTWRLNQPGGAADTPMPDVPEGFTAEIAAEPTNEDPDLVLVTASVSWNGHWGARTVELHTLELAAVQGE